MSKKVKENKLRKGELTVLHGGPVSILKWSVKKNIAVISPTMVYISGGGSKTEVCVVHYNQFICGIRKV
jgi:hypothetical protein